MKKLLFILLLLVWPTLASAHFMGGSIAAPPPFSCNPSFPNDGCAGAPAPTSAFFSQPNAFQSGGYINTVSGTPTNYMANTCGGSGGAGACRPPWLVACIDYACGPYSQVCTTNLSTTWTSSADCLLDPAILSAHGLLPSGCTYNATGNNGGPSLVCAANWSGTGLNHINIGPINSHGCTQLTLNRQTINPMVVDDLYGYNDSGLCGNSQGFYLVISGTRSPSTPPVISNFYLNGNNTQFTTIYGPTTTPGVCYLASPTPIRCNPREAIFGDDGTFKYFAVVNFAGDALNIAGTPQSGQAVWEYGLVSCYNIRAPNTHTEMFSGPNGNASSSPGVVGTTFQYVTSISCTAQSTNGTAPFFPLSGFPVQTGPLVFQNNTVVNQWSGGLTTSGGVAFTGCRGATYNSGTQTCSGTGAVFFLISGQAGWGSSLPSSCGGGGFLGPPTGNTMGALGAWWIDTGGSFTGYGDLGENNQVAAACSGSLFTTSVGNTGFLFSYGPHPAASVTIDSNYIDASSWGVSNPPLYTMGQNVTSGLTVTFTSSTTAQLTSSLGGLNNDTYINAPGVCPGDVTTCPYIPTGGNITANVNFTINLNGTSPTLNTPISGTTLGEATICTTPVSYDGLNIDMSGQATSAWMNQNTTIRSNVGC